MVGYREAEIEAREGRLRIAAHVDNVGRRAWQDAAVGCQIYDPATGLFVTEGEWVGVGAVEPGRSARVDLNVELPAGDGHYRVYVSPISDGEWLYAAGAPMLVVDAEVSDGVLRVVGSRTATLGSLRRSNLAPALRRALTEPFRDLWTNRRLIGSLVRREIRARYRGSFGDMAWTVLHPLLLMVTYFFVFGVVLQSRFGADMSRTGFALYFLAGMLPWLAFSEPMSRAAHVILENRNFVKKLVFPVSILPVSITLAGLVTSLLATLLLVAAIMAIRGALPWTAALLPLWIAPLFLFTLGLCWMLAALGVFIRDLSQMMTFVLTLWFFVTPICYEESKLPAALAPVLLKNPMFQFVRAYRMLLLEGQVPSWAAFGKLCLVSALLFFAGHFWFARLRRSMPDAL